MRRPSPALVISIIALVFAMGGTGWAVTQLPKNSVGTAQLKVGSVVTGKIAKGAVTNGKLADNAVTSAKVKDGSLAADDLTAATRAELRGTVLASANASAAGALETPDQTETVVLSTTITVAYAARLQITAVVGAINHDSGDGSPEWVPFSCWATVNGTRVGNPYFIGVIDGLLSQGAFSIVTLPVVAGAEVGPGTHRVGITCLASHPIPGYWEANNRELNVAAFSR